MPALAYIVVSTILGVAGQLALKQGMRGFSGISGPTLLRRMVLSPWVVGGMLMYGSGVLFWLGALSRLEISYVYPFASLSYVGIMIGSYFAFGERFNRTRLLGIGLVIVGVVLTGLS